MPHYDDSSNSQYHYSHWNQNHIEVDKLIHHYLQGLRNSVSDKVSCGNNVIFAELFESSNIPNHYCINFNLQSGNFVSFSFDLATGIGLYVEYPSGTDVYKEVKWNDSV